MDGARRAPEMTRGAGTGTSVRFFEQLYAIVVGLGLAFAAEQIIDLDRGTVPIDWAHVPVFFAYLNIAFSLAHSSVRYLELAYEDRLLGRLGKGRVIGDVVVGVGHFLWLIGLSLVITRPIVFVYFSIALLIGRPLRDLGVRMAGQEPLEFDLKIARMNIAAVVLFAGVAVADEVWAIDPWVLRGAVLGVSVVYGLGLYLSAFDFFFGETEEGTATAA